ncbi:hypothetical protein [Tolypothrix sp. VBCCA 56010]|uniref:hypothetical protein n=1 Tax=Tolypothrix sp. VBCCA 56010 TaxID=3137731 RepID=UPI003D7CD610
MLPAPTLHLPSWQLPSKRRLEAWQHPGSYLLRYRLEHHLLHYTVGQCRIELRLTRQLFSYQGTVSCFLPDSYKLTPFSAI